MPTVLKIFLAIAGLFVVLVVYSCVVVASRSEKESELHRKYLEQYSKKDEND